MQTNEYPLIAVFPILESFLSANDIDYKTVEIDKRNDMFCMVILLEYMVNTYRRLDSSKKL